MTFVPPANGRRSRSCRPGRAGRRARARWRVRQPGRSRRFGARRRTRQQDDAPSSSAATTRAVPTPIPDAISRTGRRRVVRNSRSPEGPTNVTLSTDRVRHAVVRPGAEHDRRWAVGVRGGEREASCDPARRRRRPELPVRDVPADVGEPEDAPARRRDGGIPKPPLGPCSQPRIVRLPNVQWPRGGVPQPPGRSRAASGRPRRRRRGS